MNDRKAENLNDRTPAIADDQHRTNGAALLIIDMIGTFKHDDGEQLFRNARPCAQKIAELKKRAKDEKLPVVFVNDNFGEWRNDFHATLEAARRSSMGGEIVRRLDPGANDYHILKPQRSGFFSTPLEVLLATLKVSTLIITGIATDLCVLFTANDAYMRGYQMMIPADCTAAITEERKNETLRLLERVADADTTPSTDLDLKRLKAVS